ncbi:MAG: UDP-N-acetylmuramoyl-L-alanine--D-glutamate ligase, partial [Clostridia bacterium]|nr:UDP-N-acetylmuramoyl-L-alanine--D-glutamate ligase [Clostridia bacterium]
MRAEFLNSFAAHNLSNALAALLACCVLKVPLEACVDSLKDYKFLPHRMQFVAQYDNVTFIDDSKATNAHATLSALKNYKDDLALIIGGSDKGEKFDGIFSYIR